MLLVVVSLILCCFPTSTSQTELQRFVFPSQTLSCTIDRPVSEQGGFIMVILQYLGCRHLYGTDQIATIP